MNKSKSLIFKRRTKKFRQILLNVNFFESEKFAFSDQWPKLHL